MEIIVETLGTTHNVIERFRFNQSRIRCGRAYANDVVLDDEHIDLDHLELQCDEMGEWWVADLQSLNGTRRNKSRKPLVRERVNSGDIFVVGRNKIRVLFADHPLPAAVKIRRTESFLLWLGRVPVLFCLLASYLTVSYLKIQLVSTETVKWSAVIGNEMQSALGILVLAVAVYLVSMLLKRGGNFLAHLSLLVVVFLIANLLDFVRELLLFNYGQTFAAHAGLINTISGYLVVLLYFWSILYLAFHVSIKRRTTISVCLVAVLLSIQLLQRQQFADFNYDALPVTNSLQPPALMLRPVTPQSEYVERVNDLFAVSDELKNSAE